MAVYNNLYPPVVETYMPAFLVDSENEEENVCKLYFSISDYNTIDDIKNAQITVRDQETNLSVLDSVKYPTEIMLTNILTDENIKTSYKYYIKISKTDVSGGFELNKYYKIQIRFTNTDASDVSLSTPQAIDSWLNTNLNNFSEWSSICLIRGISQPQLTVQGFSENETKVINWNIANTKINGKLTFKNSAETEILRVYRIKIYNNATNELLTDSETLYSNNYNSINSFEYTLKYAFTAGITYKMVIEYTTQSLYSTSKTFLFSVVQQSALTLDIILTGEKDPENGRVILHIKKNEKNSKYTGTMVIRRSSSETNFTIWEDMCFKTFEDVSLIDFTWTDYTIKSGVFYNYAVQGIENNGDRGIMTKFIDPTMVVFEHMYLVNKDRQLKIAFNPSVSSLKRVYNESKIETIGSQYPFIKRNANVNYLQFPISGVISVDMDEEKLFTTKEELFGKNLDFYEQYNIDNEITPATDIVYEKAFRDKVAEFLYANEVKIFRSPTEGNFLVRLMDISLTPFGPTGRRIWSFSATATEIDDFTIDKCKEYGILPE